MFDSFNCPFLPAFLTYLVKKRWHEQSQQIRVNEKSNRYQIKLYGPCLCLGSSRQIGEGNGTPLQYFCLENPMDGGAW